MINSELFLHKSILIVDDDETNILLLTSMLKEDGYTSIYSATGAEEAYEVLNKNKIDIILLDVMMPKIDGLEACQHIRGTPLHKNIPIIMVTADNRSETLIKSFDAGADDFVSKPINFINLKTRLQSVLLHKEKDMLILSQTRATAVNEVIDTLAHQWRQPLASISATSINIGLSYELDELTKEELQLSLNKINTYLQDLSQTINDFQNIMKIENKVLPTDVNKVIQYALKIILSSCNAEGISIEVHETPLKEILIYPNELTRVFLNILINSKEAFMRYPQTEKKLIEINISQNEVHTRISIKDNAGGIEDQYISKVFDPYFSTKQEKNGTGLGLYTCKQIIERHLEGTITLISEKNTTEFIIELPNKTF